MVTDEGHAFISYVREDAERVDRLEKILAAAGIPVWRDTRDLWPGEDWRGRIRNAITKNALAFIVCFSANSQARVVTGQNEELTLAVDQVRLRRPDQPWLIPVRFDEVDIPDVDLGGGRTLNSIQRVDLFDASWDEGAARLVAAVLRILDKTVEPASLPPPTASLDAKLKAALRDPAGDIALSDALLPIADEARAAMSNEETFPSSSDALTAGAADAAFYVADLVDEYMTILNTPLDALSVAAEWAQALQYPTLTRFVERLSPTSVGGAGLVVLTELRWFPLLPIVYTAALAASHNSNFGALKATVLDASVRDRDDGRIPVLARSHPWRPFNNFELVAQVLALRAGGEDVTRDVAEDLRTKRRGNRYTPVSDYLHDVLRKKFATIVPDDLDYDDLFDQVEILLGALAVDLRLQLKEDPRYFDRPYFGRFTWRNRYARSDEDYIERRIQRELREQRDMWPPISGGLFGGSIERATAAFEQFVLGAAEARSLRW